MKESINVFPSDKLPEGFKYPEEYLIALEKERELYPWIFIDAMGEVGQLLYTIGMSDEKKLISFASLENGDGDAACFDGRDHSGNPRIIMLILDGSERKYGFENFSDWLEKAKNGS